MVQKSLILIPARLAATRLPRKPLADINGKPMIQHVWERAKQSHCGPVVVATDSEEIEAAVRSFGGEAVMTSAQHPSGSDRIQEAMQLYDNKGEFDIILNIQGDLPTLDPALPAAAAKLLENPEVAIGTLACVIEREEEKTAPQVVKVVGTPVGAAPNCLKALYFTRATAPSGEGTLYHHIGLYAYRRSALETFCTLPPSPLEQREKLEQLRALEHGMRIDVALVDTVPLGVDTSEDLERARAILK